MSNFTKRLKYYGIGFGLGLVIVFFFFGNRGCNWGPEARVKTSIKERVLVINEANEVALKERGISKEEIMSLIDDSDIDFGESKKDESLKVYAFKNDNFNFLISLPYESFIAEISLKETIAEQFQNTTHGAGKFLVFPKEKDLIFVPDHPLLNCQMKDMGFKDNNDLFKAIKLTGEIDFKACTFDLRPKAEHLIRFTDKKNRKVGAKCIWMKEKIEIVSFSYNTNVSCK